MVGMAWVRRTCRWNTLEHLPTLAGEQGALRIGPGTSLCRVAGSAEGGVAVSPAGWDEAGLEQRVSLGYLSPSSPAGSPPCCEMQFPGSDPMCFWVGGFGLRGGSCIPTLNSPLQSQVEPDV